MSRKFILSVAAVIGILTTLMVPVTASAAPPVIIEVPEDYPTIQEAIDAANSGDTIIVHAGIYEEGVFIPPGKDGITLSGESGTIMDGDDEFTKPTAIAIGASGVTVEGFTIYNYRKVIPPNGLPFWRYGTGINSGPGSNGNIIQNNKIEKCIDGISVGGSNHQILGNDVKGCSWHGINVWPMTPGCQILENTLIECHIGISVSGINSLIEGNDVTGASMHGIGTYSPANGNAIQFNEITDSSTGIGVGGNNTQVLDNTIAGSSECGIGVFNGVTGSTIAGNHVADSGHNGIILLDTHSNQVYQNDVSNSGYNGIDLTMGSTMNSVCENQVTNSGIDPGSGGNGIILQQSSNDNTVMANIILISSFNGIAVQDGSSGNTITGNHITESGSKGGSGIMIMNAHNNTVDENTVMLSHCGIRINGTNNDIHGNHLNNNEMIFHLPLPGGGTIPLVGPGIGIDVGASNNKIHGNHISSSGGTGIMLHGDNNKLTGNKVTESGFDGVVMFPTATDNIIQANKINGNTKHGIVALGEKSPPFPFPGPGSSGNIIKSNTVLDNGGLDLFADELEDNTWKNNKYETSNF
ncbi:MAG TPA: hypothetical protein G4O15_05055 [Dehalococcoidia bacterium]|nr:hypothetical protein [Dehalococcoidia bacterium]